MTTENTQNTQTRETGRGNRPTHVAKVRIGRGKNASYDQIGVAWENEDGSVYVKLHGTQIIESGFTLYELPGGEKAEG